MELCVEKLETDLQNFKEAPQSRQGREEGHCVAAEMSSSAGD